MRYTTLQYRIKDATTGKHLDKMAGAVNFVWNYCNEVNQDRWKKFRKTFSAFDLQKLAGGCASDLGLHSQTVTAICTEYATRSKQHKKTRLNWRSKKRNLGWIPFSGGGVKIKNETVTYKDHKFCFWLSRPIEGIIDAARSVKTQRDTGMLIYLLKRLIKAASKREKKSVLT